MSYLYYLIGIPIIYFIIRRIFNGRPTPITKIDVKDKIIVITGCSAGIGKETSKELLRHGAKVIFACRDEKKTNDVINTLPEESKKRATFIQLDLSSFESCRNFEKKFGEKFSKLDILINNAGNFNDTFILTKDNIEATLQCNHLSHMYLTSLLLKYLTSEKGRVINVSSEAHTFIKTVDMDGLEKDLDFKLAGPIYSGFYAYGFSKLTNIYFSLSLAKFFEKKKIDFKVVSLHPGSVKTEIARPKNLLFKIVGWMLYPVMVLFFQDAFMGAQTTLHLCYMDYFSLINGGYYANCKLDKITPLASDESTRKRFMEYSRKLIETRVNKYPEDLDDMVKC